MIQPPELRRLRNIDQHRKIAELIALTIIMDSEQIDALITQTKSIATSWPNFPIWGPGIEINNQNKNE